MTRLRCEERAGHVSPGASDHHADINISTTTANSRVEFVEEETNELIFKLLPPTERHLKLCSKHFSVILE